MNLDQTRRHIIIVGTAFPFRGGLAVYNERLARQFQEEGWDVTIYTFSLQYPSFLFPGKSQYDDRPAPSDLTILQKVNSIHPFNWIKVGREIKNNRPEMVLFRFWIPLMAPCFGTIARIIRCNHYTKVVCIADNVIPHEKRLGDKWLTRYFINAMQGAVTMSKSVLQDLNQLRPSLSKAWQSHPLYDNFGTPVSREEACRHLDLPTEGSYLLFFGFIRAYKGLDWLLQAFADPRLRSFPTQLIIAGEFYENPKPYMDLIKSLGLENHIILRTQFIADEEVKYYFCAADLVVQPYKSATQSGVTQICYHFNKPMLVTHVGGLAEMIPDQKVGYVVQPEVCAIASALVNFYDQHRQHEFDQGIIDEKSKYQWSNMTKAISQL